MPDVSINIVGAGAPDKKFDKFINAGDKTRRIPIYKVEKPKEPLLKRIKHFLVNGISENE